MAVAYNSIKHSKIHPKFLHSNSTSHRWAFGAVAELIDNAMDPDVNATQFCIDMQEFGGEVCLVFMDNGYGMTPEMLHKMLGFGHSDKKEVDGHRPIGFYGNGFKSGSMRLGRDALVLTKCNESMSVGFLSQSFLKMEGLQEILVPIVTWDLEGYCMHPETKETKESLRAITKYSVFQDEDSLLLQIDAIPECGTIIIISNLRRNGRQYELDFHSDKFDIRISSDEPFEDCEEEEGGLKFQQSRPSQPRRVDVPLDYSLRSYVNVLYKVPRMQIFIRNKKVKCQRITSLLRDKIHETYRPREVAAGVKCEIEMGFNTENEELYGMMLYHRNRLIKPYLRVGIQQDANSKGVGVLGVVEADFLQPTHNKQNFDNTKFFRAMINKLSVMLKYYWFERVENVPRNMYRGEYTLEGDAADEEQERERKKRKERKSIPDDLWVQCDFPKCLKWRRLPGGTNPATLPEMWFCYLHPDPEMQDHNYPEERYDGGDDNNTNFSLKDAKRKFDMAKKEKRLQVEAKEKEKEEELQKKMDEAQKIRKKLEQEREEFEREKKRVAEEQEEIKRQAAAAAAASDGQRDDSQGVKRRKMQNSVSGLDALVDGEELDLPTNWEEAVGLAGEAPVGQPNPGMSMFMGLDAGDKPGGTNQPGSARGGANHRKDGVGRQDRQVEREQGGDQRPPARGDGEQPISPAMQAGPGVRYPHTDPQGRDDMMETHMQADAMYGMGRPHPGSMMGGQGMNDTAARQMMMQMMAVCRRFRHCLLRFSHAAGYEDDTMALTNLSPRDLMMFDTDSLSDKFHATIMENMRGGFR